MKSAPFWQAIAVIAATYLFFSYAFPPIMPASVMAIYMTITVIGILLYFSFDEDRWQGFKLPISALLFLQQLQWLRILMVLTLPLGVGGWIYLVLNPGPLAPIELRQAHPAPPNHINIDGRKISLKDLNNPLREEVLLLAESDISRAEERYSELVNVGRDLYYQNCLFCHGTSLEGKGPFALGSNPQPTNFLDVAVIPQLQESFLFWRIATGGPGMPNEGAPWNSIMPVWHQDLSEEDIWTLILFLYDFSRTTPLTWEPELAQRINRFQKPIYQQRQQMLGRPLYDYYCAACHGEQGMGDGIAADRLYPRPRDFSLALYKYKSSPPGLLATDEDLMNSIRHGLPGTSMPGWNHLLTEEQVRSLIPLLKGFDISGFWAPEDADDELFDEDGHYLKDDYVVVHDVESLDNPVAYSEESTREGEKLYREACEECHGESGRGDIISGKPLADDWEQRIWPRNLHKPWNWRSIYWDYRDPKLRQKTIDALYLRITLGLPGTPMPVNRATTEGDKDPISREGRWHLANYLYDLALKASPAKGEMVVANYLDNGVPDQLNDPRWSEITPVNIHLIPNTIQGERLYTPLNDMVSIRAYFDDERVALLLELDDRTDSRPGNPYTEQIQDAQYPLNEDALALQFPSLDSYEITPMVIKPSFRHGEPERPTQIWYWQAGKHTPYREPKFSLLSGNGLKNTLQREQDGLLSGSSVWSQGRHSLLFIANRFADENRRATQFLEDVPIPLSLANWDGSNGEQGSRHTLSSWNWMVLKKPVSKSERYLFPVIITLLLWLLGLLLMKLQRKYSLYTKELER